MGKRVLSVFGDGGMYFSLSPVRYEDAETRQAVFDIYMSLGLLERQLTLEEVNDGRFSRRTIDQFDADEWARFKDFLNDYFG